MSLGGGPRKTFLWKPHAPAASNPTACVGGVAAVKLGKRCAVADAIREATTLVQA